jgi:signal transduction histidine kinase
MINRRSITVRLLALYCGLLLLLGASFSLFTVLSFERYTRATVEANISARDAEAWEIVRPVMGNPTQVSDLIEQRFSPSAQDRFFRITRNGMVIYRSGQPVDGSFDATTIPAPAPGPRGITRVLGRLILYTNQYRAPDGTSVIIESGQTDVFAMGMEVSLVTSLVIGLPILLLLAAMGGYVLIRRALAPVETMIKAAEAISFSNPGNRLPLMGSGDRVEALGLALNRMLDRLDTTYQHANRFSSDAAHELRTPLAIIQGELESAVLGKDLPPGAESAIGTVLEEVSRLSKIVDNLLKLSRMDRPSAHVAWANVDLFELAGETIDQMQLLAGEKQVVLKGPTGARTSVNGDRDRLKQILVNLLDNAIKYNMPGGQVVVDVNAAGGQARLTVADTGIGIAPENLDYIFDRFYRVSTNRGDSGAGLGLAIVKSICLAHGGDIQVRSSPGAGTTFSVTLPLAPSASTASAEPANRGEIRPREAADSAA